MTQLTCRRGTNELHVQNSRRAPPVRCRAWLAARRFNYLLEVLQNLPPSEVVGSEKLALCIRAGVAKIQGSGAILITLRAGRSGASAARGSYSQSPARAGSAQTQRAQLATGWHPRFLSVCSTHGVPLPLDQTALPQVPLRLGHRLFVRDPRHIAQLPCGLLPAAPPAPAIARRDGL